MPGSVATVLSSGDDGTTDLDRVSRCQKSCLISTADRVSTTGVGNSSRDLRRRRGCQQRSIQMLEVVGLAKIRLLNSQRDPNTSPACVQSSAELLYPRLPCCRRRASAEASGSPCRSSSMAMPSTRSRPHTRETRESLARHDFPLSPKARTTATSHTETSCRSRLATKSTRSRSTHRRERSAMVSGTGGA